MSTGIYVEGFKDLPNGDKELFTATIETDLALRMLVDYLGLEYVFGDKDCPECYGKGSESFINGVDVCPYCNGTGKVKDGKPVIQKKK